MKLAFVIALVAFPSFASAACEHDRTAQSCASGSIWDDAKGACVSVVTG